MNTPLVTLEEELEHARSVVARSLPHLKRPDVLELATAYLVTGSAVWGTPDMDHWNPIDSLVWDIIYYLQTDSQGFEIPTVTSYGRVCIADCVLNLERLLDEIH
jgi:hypothetical protein